MFWIIFGTASFTALVVLLIVIALFMRGTAKTQEYARKRGYCPTCGAFRMTMKQVSKKSSIGFRGQHNE